jgi:hypothetical protein
MGAISTMRKLAGIADDAAALAAELQAARTEGAQALDEAERLEAARLTAENFEEAEKLARQAAAARWRADKAAAGLPDLEARLARAQAKERAEALARHWTRRRAVYLKLKAALEEAARLQAEAIGADEAACRELGEHVARSLPSIAYRGFVAPDFVQIWTTENDRVFALPAPKPLTTAARKAAAPAAPVARQYLAHERKPTIDTPRSVSLALENRPTPKQPRPADDMSELAPGTARVRVMRAGFSPADDRPQSHFGQVVVMPLGAARRSAEMAAIEILEVREATEVPNTPAAAPTVTGETT